MWPFSGRKLECFQEYEACCPTAPILTTQIPKSSSKGKGPLNSQFSVRRNKAIQLRAQAMPHGKGRMPWREEKCPESRKKSHRDHSVCVCVCVRTGFGRWGTFFSFTFPWTFCFTLFCLLPAMVMFFPNVKEKKRNSHCHCITRSPYCLVLQS